MPENDEQEFLQYEANYVESSYLPHQIYRGGMEDDALRRHKNYRDFPPALLQETKWTKNSHANRKLNSLVSSHVVSEHTTITQLRNDLGGAMWFFWNYSDAVLEKNLKKHFRKGNDKSQSYLHTSNLSRRAV